MIKEELEKIVNENRAMRREEEYERLKKQQEEQALKDEIIKEWREMNQSKIERKIETVLIECATKTNKDWIEVDASDLIMATDRYDFLWVYQITDEDVKAYCKEHKLKFRYWYHRECSPYCGIESKDKYVHRYRRPFFDFFHTGIDEFCFTGYAIHI